MTIALNQYQSDYKNVSTMKGLDRLLVFYYFKLKYIIKFIILSKFWEIFLSLCIIIFVILCSILIEKMRQIIKNWDKNSEWEKI